MTRRCPRADDHTHDVQIRSTADPQTGAAACLLDWGPAVQALLTPDVVLTTARDLMAAAAHAEADIALITLLRTKPAMDWHAIGVMLREIRAQRPAPTGKTALRIEAVAGARTGRALVHIGRGSMKGELDPAEARQMAQHWTEAAVAAQIDVRLRYVLGEWDRLSRAEIDELFRLLQAVQR
ncbi:hypothetical protein [Streptomyces sp. 049-1]|uniref:hypothetical protein n=1 Tax=Streptomyces sp. 049-1 TaxID=2789264 RepID=UPI00397FE5B5